MNEHHERSSVSTLLGDLVTQVSTLLQTEAQILRAEMSEKIGNLGSGAVEILGGAICLLAALMVLLQALVIALANAGLGAGWSSLLVGVVVAILGFILLRTGTNNMSPSKLTPDRTREQLKRDAHVVKEQLR